MAPPIPAHTKNVIYNVHSFFIKRKADKDSIEHKMDMNINKLVGEATGVSARTVMRIVSEGKISIKNYGKVQFAPPRKPGERKKKIKIDDVGMGAIRQKIHRFYTVDKTIPSISRLNAALRDEGIINCGTTYLRELLHKMGYSFQKCQSNNKVTRPILVERPIIGERRVTYLRAIRQYRQENRKIYFIDETYISCSNSSGCWQSEAEPISADLSKGRRLIIVHCGSREGLVDGALMICKSDPNSSDHQGDMNSIKFYNWVDSKLKDKLPPNSVVVMNNATYHSEQVRKPSISSLKTHMREWLSAHSIPFTLEMTKPELLGLINRTQSETIYTIDEMLKSAGHTVLRLPPHHPDLNPMQRMWGEIKLELATNYANSTMDEKIPILTKLFSEFSAEKFQMCDDHVQIVENLYWEHDFNFDNVIDELIIKQENESDPGEDSEQEGMLCSDEDIMYE